MRLVVSSMLVVSAMAAPARAGLTPVDDFGSNPGALDMFEYVPADLPTGRPLVVVLHGCTQSAAAMEPAGWNALADAHGFAVLYPQQRSANQQINCFTWYERADVARGSGEAASIVQMIDKAVATHALDRDRVYVTGISAGGAMAAALIAAYPDRFRAASIMAGVPYGCASDVSTGSSCASSGVQKTPAQWGDLVRGAFDHGGLYPRVQIWHGAMDYTVNTANATELVDQWTDVWATDQTADATEAVSTATYTRYMAGDRPAVELYLVEGMGHAIATGQDALGACPSTSGAFFTDKKICSTLRAAAFFALLGDEGEPDTGSGSGSGTDTDTGADGGCNTGSAQGLLAILLFAAARRRRRGATR